MSLPVKHKERIRRLFRRCIPRDTNGPKSSPPATKAPSVPSGHTQEEQSSAPQPNSHIRPETSRQIVPQIDRTIPAPAPTIQVDISDLPEWFRELMNLPPEGNIFHIDPQDWATVQRNFPGPLGHHFDPDDPDKPEEYAPIWDPLTRSERNLRVVPQFQHEHEQHRNRVPGQQEANENDEDDKAAPPPPPPPSYKWATISTLPSPVKIGCTWASIFAAQREMSHLLEIQSYINTRIPEIKRQSASVLKVKTEDIPMFEFTYLMARVEAGLRPVVPETDIMHPGDPRCDRPYWEMMKVMFLRERLSPVSFLSFRGRDGGGGDRDDPWGWDWDHTRVESDSQREARRKAGEFDVSGIHDYIAI